MERRAESVQPKGHAIQMPVAPRPSPFAKRNANATRQEEVGECGCHEIEHGTATAQHPITHDLNRYDEIEGGDDVHIVYTCLNCGSTAFIQKQPHGGAAEEEIEQEKRYADQNTEERPCPKAFGNPFLFICAEVLSGEGGNAVGQGCHTGDGKGIQLLAGRKASNNGRAIAIDGRLHEKIPDGNKALLQNTWNGDDGNLYKHFCGKFCIRLGAS